MEELAKVIVLLAILGTVIAYVQGGTARVGELWRLKLVGEPA